MVQTYLPERFCLMLTVYPLTIYLSKGRLERYLNCGGSTSYFLSDCESDLQNSDYPECSCGGSGSSVWESGFYPNGLAY